MVPPSELAEEVMGETGLAAQLWTVVAGSVLALFHIVSPWVHAARSKAAHASASFAGGMAAAFVFLHLLPELDDSHQHLGERVYFIVLVGFVAFYLVEHLHYRRGDHMAAEAPSFAVRLGTTATYNYFLSLTLSENMPAYPRLLPIFLLGLGVHLIIVDNHLEERFGASFRGVGRLVLVLAILAGAATGIAVDFPHVWVDAITAVFAGFMLFTVFREEIPDSDKAFAPAFLGGATLFVVIHILAG